eukprot:CAMPEP_0173177890 /NCGR_PEP_ID=MMETSP1141-20130122/5231_1 /TAXON_ID=483371 /ORGANISM="non described non described, Strain CCMP2298" /LENGTH=183 /DNA_ID=CAMNT_0014100319 /DNA_START=137 /DNA_END=687 /DNA_ORIENTATION=+
MTGGEGLVVAVGGALVDLGDDVHAGGDLAEHGVLGGGGFVEEVEEAVVLGVDEELGPTGVGLAGVGHGEGADLVGQLGAVGLSELVRDVAPSVAGDLALARAVVRGAAGGAAGASALGVGVSGVGAAELVHEVRNHAVEVQAVVVALVGQGDEVVGRDRHLLGEQLDLERPHGGLDGGSGRHD